MRQTQPPEPRNDPYQATPEPARVVLRPLGTPLPLGFLGLTVATSSFATVQLGWVPLGQTHTVAMSALLFAVPLQALVAVLGFMSRDPVAGTGVGVLAGTWAVLGFEAHNSPAGSTSSGLGIILFCASAALLVPTISGRKKLVASLVLLVAACRFAATGMYEFTASSAWNAVAGWIGIALGVVALYAALAFELEGSHGRTLLPTGRPSPVWAEGEPGVRRTL